MTRKEGDNARKAEARNGLIKDGAAQHAGAGAATGADFDAAYEHAVAGRTAEAEAVCRKILASDPTNAKALHLLGQIAAQSGNAPAAIELFNRVLDAIPGLATAHYNLGVLLLGQGETEEAVNHFEKAIESEPDFVPAHNDLGYALYSQGKLEEAITSFQKAVALEPDFAPAHNNLGNALKDQGKLAAAVASYQKAIALEPNVAEAHNNLGIAFKEQGRLEEPIASFQKAVALEPNYAEAHNNLGNALKDQGKLAAAVASYQKAIALEPNMPEAYYNLGIALQEQARFEEATASYQKAIALRPNYAEAHNNLGNALKEQDRLEEAEASYRNAIALSPEFADVHRNMFRVLFELGDQKGATKHYKVWKSKNTDKASDTQTSIFVFTSARMNSSMDYTQTPYIGEFEDVSVLTSHWLVFKENKIFYEELLNRNIKRVPFVEAVAPDGGIIADVPKEYCVVEDPCILLGGSTLYWHWMVDYLTRLAVIERDKDIRHLPLLVNDDLSRTQQESLELLEIPVSRLIKVKSPAHVRCNRLFVPTILAHDNFTHPIGVHWLRHSFKSKIKEDHNATRKYLFVSRRDTARRRLLNEDELVDALAPFGFQVVLPAQLHFKEQIKIFSEARLIVGPHGSGLLNMIYSPNDVQIIEIKHRYFPRFGVENLAKSAGISHKTVFGEVKNIAYNASPLDKQRADFAVDVEAVLKEVRALIMNRAS